MRPLAIIVAEGHGARLSTALTLAAAAAATGRSVTMLFDGTSVAALARDTHDPLRAAVLDMGVGVTACQTGLAACAMAIDDLADGITTGGMIGFLGDAGDADIVLG